MRHDPSTFEAASILKGTDRDLSLPMHAPSELPTLDLDDVQAEAAPRRGWLQRLFGRRERVDVVRGQAA